MANSAAVNYYVQRTMGSRGALLAAMGSTAYEIPSTFVVVASGTNYRLALAKSVETAWVSKPSGEYPGPIDVTFTAVSQTEGAQLVYTLDGSEPTASNGTKVANGASINISSSKTLKVGLLINGAVSGVITRHYEIESSTFVPYEITVYLKDPTVAPNNWTQVNYFSWDDTSSPNGPWPGQTITDTEMVGGVKFYYAKYTIKSKNYFVNFVFNQGGSTASSHQTVDVTDVNKTSFFEVTTQTNKYQVKDVTADYLHYLDSIQGDVNGDGEVNIADVNCLIAVILGAEDIYEGRADVNNDGEINIADVNAVITIIQGS